MDAHGGWIASAVDLVHFASAFDSPIQCKILNATSIDAMFARPDGQAGETTDHRPKTVYYGCGWNVRPAGGQGRLNTWHTGSLDGTATLLVRRHDGLNWAILFNSRNGAGGKYLAGAIDGLIHKAADEVKSWPTIDLFERYL